MMDWDRIYQFVLDCGSVHDPYRFSTHVVDGFHTLMDFDSAMVFFLDGNRRIVDQYLCNFDPRLFRLYVEYYSKIDMSSSGIGLFLDAAEPGNEPFIFHIDWTQVPPSDFLTEYVSETDTGESLTFVLYDLNRQPRSVFTFNVRTGKHFSDADLEQLDLVVPLLNNYHKNFYVKIPGGFRHSNPLYTEANLTKRETEIVDLICQGVSSVNISKILHIAPSTTYKHVTHIFEKFHVANRQELLVKLLNQEV